MEYIITISSALAIFFIVNMMYKSKNKPMIGDIYASRFNFKDNIVISNVGRDKQSGIYVEYYKTTDPSYPYIKDYKDFCRSYVNIKWEGK